MARVRQIGLDAQAELYGAGVRYRDDRRRPGGRASATPDAEPAKEGENPGKKHESPASDKAAEAAAAPAGAIPYNRLPLPDDATKVEYKKLVGQIKCQSATDHKSVARALAKKLEDQGWTVGGADVTGPKSAILKRKRGQAELTIFVKPSEGGGSSVTVMSKGL